MKELFKLKDIFKVPCGGFSFLFSTTRGAVELRKNTFPGFLIQVFKIFSF